MALTSTLSFIAGHPLNEGRKVVSLLRYVRWQLGSRLLRCDSVYNWVNGSKFYVRTGETGLTGNIYVGLHEFADMAYLLHVLRPEDLFIDVGANAGSYTILAGGVVGASGYAFEPIPDTHKRLVENLRLNHIESMIKHPNVGIGETPGILRFTTDADTVNHALSEGEVALNTASVEISTLDLQLANENPALIKLDVEGFETPVINGAKDTLGKESLHSIIMELNGSGERYGFDERRILEKMHDHGFQAYSYEPLIRQLSCLESLNTESGNTLFIRNMAFVEKRIAEAPIVRVNGRGF